MFLKNQWFNSKIKDDQFEKENEKKEKNLKLLMLKLTKIMNQNCYSEPSWNLILSLYHTPNPFSCLMWQTTAYVSVCLYLHRSYMYIIVNILSMVYYNWCYIWCVVVNNH